MGKKIYRHKNKIFLGTLSKDPGTYLSSATYILVGLLAGWSPRTWWPHWSPGSRWPHGAHRTHWPHGRLGERRKTQVLWKKKYTHKERTYILISSVCFFFLEDCMRGKTKSNFKLLPHTIKTHKITKRHAVWWSSRWWQVKKILNFLSNFILWCIYIW